jgi:iron(III) transport system substrate-binding protein
MLQLRPWGVLLIGLVGLLNAGCPLLSGGPSVTVYTAHDEEYSRRILESFATRTGVQVRPKFDTEAAKTVGLVQLILQEVRSGTVRCDLFWNNEILGTLRLQAAGALEPVQVPEAQEIPQAFRAADGSWWGFAARARVLLVNSELVPETEQPRGLEQLTEPRWRGKVAMANPMFGTTHTHAVVLFQLFGSDAARRWFEQLRANDVRVLPGHRHVAEAVAQGVVAVGLTDTDDALVQLRRRAPVRIVFPDDRGLGTLVLPNTACVIRGSRRKESAVKLLRYLVSEEVEKRLALGPSGQIPLRPRLRPDPDILQAPAGAFLQTLRALPVNYEALVGLWEEANQFLAQWAMEAQRG